MVDEFNGARIGVKIDDQWCGALLYSMQLILCVDRHRSDAGFCG